MQAMQLARWSAVKKIHLLLGEGQESRGPTNAAVPWQAFLGPQPLGGLFRNVPGSPGLFARPPRSRCCPSVTKQSKLYVLHKLSLFLRCFSWVMPDEHVLCPAGTMRRGESVTAASARSALTGACLLVLQAQLVRDCLTRVLADQETRSSKSCPTTL